MKSHCCGIMDEPLLLWASATSDDRRKPRTVRGWAVSTCTKGSWEVLLWTQVLHTSEVAQNCSICMENMATKEVNDLSETTQATQAAVAMALGPVLPASSYLLGTPTMRRRGSFSCVNMLHKRTWIPGPSKRCDTDVGSCDSPATSI